MATHFTIGAEKYLTKEGLQVKLFPLGIKTKNGLNRFLLANRDTFPVKRSPATTQPYYCEAEVDAWLVVQQAAPKRRSVNPVTKAKAEVRARIRAEAKSKALIEARAKAEIIRTNSPAQEA